MKLRILIPLAAAPLFACSIFTREEPIPVPTLVTADPDTPVVASPLPNTQVPVELSELPGAENLAILEAVVIPYADELDLARRMEGLAQEVPDRIEPPPAPPQLGDRELFWVRNSDDDEQFRTSATLRYATDHAYHWIGDDVSFSRPALEELGAFFEEQIYPTTRAFFGSEATPGIDGDEHIYILYVSGLGSRIAGYFSSVDGLHPLLREESNGHEMFVLNADTVDLDSPFTYGTLAHEFQHMIHWNVDRDETSWLNEGFSELSARINRLFAGAAFTLYIEKPDLQLNDWPNQEESRLPNYGAAFLFTNYLLDRLGQDFTRAVVAHPENGLVSIDLVLQEAGIEDPLRSRPLTADDLVMDWAITNYLDSGGISDGRFGYDEFGSFDPALPTDTLFACPEQGAEREIRQYGVHYLRLSCDAPTTLRFVGATQTEVLPASAFSGDLAFWSNKGDHSDMRLTREFDFTNVEAPISLDFKAWYDIETDWDYVYLMASADGGKIWEFIETPSGTDRDPNGNNYGFGWTSTTPALGWVEENVDLSQYAGQKVLLRFEYVTDAAVFGEGMLIDDLSIPAIGYFSDFEDDSGGWEAAGWARVANVLPQTFELALLTLGDEVAVDYIPVGANNTASIALPTLADGGERVLVIVPTTRLTRQPASYSINFEQ